MIDPADLYGLPLERFTEERNALVKELRAAGRREQAARVAGMRKPSLSAWAVNQLVRTQRRQIRGLFDAGDRLQQAQSDLLGGRGDPASLRKAARAERTAIDRLTDKARGLLSADGHELAASRLEQVSETLHAAALDDHARDQMRDGCLTRELRHAGLGALGAAGAPAPAKRRASAPSAAARRAAAAARGRAERAARDMKVAEQRRNRAERQLRQAKEALDTAREQAERTQRELRQAEQALEDV